MFSIFFPISSKSESSHDVDPSSVDKTSVEASTLKDVYSIPASNKTVLNLYYSMAAATTTNNNNNNNSGV